MPQETNDMERPKITIPFTMTDKIIEVINVIVLISFWALLFLNYAKLPEIIPVHYNAAGEVDNVGNRISLFILPIISTVIFFALSYLSKIPHTFNYIVEIDSENAKTQYTIATKMLRYLKLSVTVVFFLIFYKTVEIVNGEARLLGKYFLIFTLAIIFLPMLYFYIQSVKSK